MIKEEINYADQVLSPDKDVFVPMPVYATMINILQQVEKQHSKIIKSDKYSWYNKLTHVKLSDKGRAKIDNAKLQKEYYENIDFEATEKTTRVDRDELGSAAIKMLAELRGVFKHNVDLGNSIPNPNKPAPQQVSEPVAKAEVPQVSPAPTPVVESAQDNSETNEG